jgi:hypothetical protein
MRSSLRSERGSALIFALAIVLVLAIVGVAIIRIAGADRTDAALQGKRDRGLACAEAGLQYARRFFGVNYEASHGWNDYLNGTTPGYRYDPQMRPVADTYPTPTQLAAKPMQTRGQSNGTSFDPGADLDGDGQPDFWVSIRDDDDERPLGLANDDRTRDNNETVVLRSECTNPAWAIVESGVPTNVVLEALFTHVQGSSGYGTAARVSNAPDLVGGR